MMMMIEDYLVLQNVEIQLLGEAMVNSMSFMGS